MKQISGFASIDSLRIPDDWSEEEERSTAIMLMKQFHPPEHPNAEITAFKRRKSIPAEAVEALCKVLDEAPHKLEQGGVEILSLTRALGNVGNNQWSNRSTGDDAANFRLLSAQTNFLNGKKVLTVSGAFIDPETKKAITEYCGIFIAVTAPRPCVEEVYLQVPSEYGYYHFEKYLRVFRKTMENIHWISDFKP